MKKKLLKKRISNLEKTVQSLIDSNVELSEENEMLLDRVIDQMKMIREFERQLGFVAP